MKKGSPLARRYSGPDRTPSAEIVVPGSTSIWVRQTCAGPRLSRAAKVVTSFMTEAGLRGCPAFTETMRGPSTGSTTTDSALSGSPVAAQAADNSAGRSCARAMVNARQAHTAAAPRIHPPGLPPAALVPRRPSATPACAPLCNNACPLVPVPWFEQARA